MVRWSRRRWMALAVVLLVVFGAARALTTEPSVTGTFVGASYRTQCLPGQSYLPNPTVCALTLGDAGDTRGEPWIAVDPNDHDTLVVATNARSPDTAPEQPEPEPEPQHPLDRVNDTLGIGREPEAPPPTGEPCTGFVLCLHVSEDGGATWTERAVPRLDRLAIAQDPSLAFTPDGVLHLVGLRVSNTPVAYARTGDLGRTWDDVRLLTEATGHDDRPWIASNDDGDLLVTWRTTDDRQTRFLHLPADSTTWNTIDDPLDCIMPSVPRPDADVWMVTCQGATVPRTLVYRLDADTGDITHLGTVPDLVQRLAYMGHDPNGNPVVIKHGRLDWGGTTVYARTSHDGGKTWAPARDLLAPVNIDDDWDWAWLSWATTDAHGMVHALVVGGPDPLCWDQNCPSHATTREVWWLAADPTSGDVLGVERLTPGDPDARSRGRPAADNVGDHYHHIVPYEGGVLVAWGHDRLVDVGHMRPAAPAR